MHRSMKKLLLFLLLASSLSAQSITTPLANQTATVGQAATFTVTVSGGPCRSLWSINGVGHYGAVASTLSYTFPAVTLAQNGTTVAVDLYGCAGGSIELRPPAVTLTVVSAPAVLQSLAILTTNPTIGIGQTDALSVSGTYSDGTTKDLTSTATWTSDNSIVASVSAGNVLGMAEGVSHITATVGNLAATTTLTVEHIINVVFAPLYDDGTVPALQLIVNQIVTNPDGTVTSTVALQLPDLVSNSLTGSFLVNKSFTYQAQILKTGTTLGFSMPYEPVLLLALMPQISTTNFNVTLFKASGLVKSYNSGAQ
jgi:hypothetical protein